MTVISKYKIENKYLILGENIKKLKLLNDKLTFQIIVSNTIKLL
jgi:hypothetical protein